VTSTPPRPARGPRAGAEVHLTQAFVYGLIAGGYFAPVLLLLTVLLNLSFLGGVLLFVTGELAIVGAVGTVSYQLAERAGRAAQALYAPSGTTTPYQRSFSYQQAMAMRGDVAGALASFEALIVELADDVPVRLAAAHLYAEKGKDAARAAALYREARLLPSATRATELAATNALIDLYRGPLADEARMLAELRRLAERFAGTPPGELAREELARVRSMRQEPA